MQLRAAFYMQLLHALYTDSNMMHLKSKQQDVFEVERAMFRRSVTVENMLQDTILDEPVPLPTIDSSTLAKARKRHLP